jgi:hypothetical protein
MNLVQQALVPYIVIGEFWDTNTQGPDIKVDHLGSRPWGHHHAHKLDSPSSMPGPMRMKLPTVVHYI